MNDQNINFATMTKADFEQHLPDFFATGNGKVSKDPRLQLFLANNPDCAALVRDLETIAEYAGSLLEPADDPSDQVWAGIQAKLQQDPIASDTGVPQDVKDEVSTDSDKSSRNGLSDQLVTGGSLNDLD